MRNWHQTEKLTGADPGFSFRRGEGRKMFCASTHITNAEPNSLSVGVQGPLKGPGSSRVILMLSRAIWALFLSILIIKKNDKKHSWSNFRGGGGRLLRPPGSATELRCIWIWGTVSLQLVLCRPIINVVHPPPVWHRPDGLPNYCRDRCGDIYRGR